MPARISAHVARYGWLAAIAAAYLYVFPYFPRIHSANELPRVYLVRAIVDDHTFAIDTGVARWGGTSDMAGHAGHLYSNKAPGSSLLAVPVYALVRAFADPSLAVTLWICRIVSGVIPALGLLWLLWGYLERFTPDPAVRRLVLIAYSLGSLAMPYSVLYFSHQLSAVCIGAAWILAIDFADRRRGWVAIAAAGFLAGCAPLVDYQAAFAGIPVAVHVVIRLRKWPRRELVRAIAIATAAAVVPIAMLLAYHAACFGSPLSTGYANALTYASDHDHGLLGMTYPTLQAFYGSMFAPDNGFITLAPWWLAAIPGGVMLWRRGDRQTPLVAAGVAVVLIYFISSIGFWRAGWEVGPRYITAMQPFLLPLVAVAIASWRERPLLIGAVGGAIVCGVTIYVLSLATFPYWPDSLRDPFYEVTLRLLGDHAVAPNLANVVGAAGLVSIAPLFLGVAGLVGWAIHRVAGFRPLAMAVTIGIAFVLALALVPHGGPRADRAYTQTIYPAVAQ